MRLVVLDTETTGLSPKEGHRIIEIACVEIINRHITDHYFHSYINPERVVEEGAFKIHGLNNAFLEKKPIFSSVVDNFLQFIKGAQVIAHNAAFDIEFLNCELTLIKEKKYKMLDYYYTGITDTLLMARKRHVGQRNTLDALCKRYHVNNSNRNLHGALIDANLLAQVYLAMTGGQVSLFDETIVYQQMQNQLDVSNKGLEKMSKQYTRY